MQSSSHSSSHQPVTGEHNENAYVFSPPSADKVSELLDRYVITEPSAWFKMGPGLLLGLALFSTFALNEGMAGFFFLLPMGVFFFISIQRRQQRKRREDLIRSLTMQCQLRDDPHVLRGAWRILPELTHSADLYARVVLLLAQSLHHVKAHDAALVAYGWLDTRVPPESEIGAYVKLQRAILLLMTDQLADADANLRRLQGQIEANESADRSALSALLAFAEMLQLLKTFNYRQLLARQNNAITRLRPLGILAGLGYGLLAYAAYQLMIMNDAQEDASINHGEREKLQRFAHTWWHRATLLMKPDRLAWHLPELSVLVDDPDMQEVVTAEPPLDISPSFIPAYGTGQVTTVPTVPQGTIGGAA